MGLDEYRRKREFSRTSEPSGDQSVLAGNRFVVQYHQSRRPHYDLRLELDGTLKSWAVPKGPCLDPKEKRLAIHVEDHPLDYVDFEGTIPDGEYGAGTVLVWDFGTWHPLEGHNNSVDGGKLKFVLNGQKLSGAWMLVKIRPKPGQKEDCWLLIKERDDSVVPLEEVDILTSLPNSVKTGRGIEQIKNAEPLRQLAQPMQSTIEEPKKPSTKNKPVQSSKVKSNKRPTAKTASPMPDWIEPQLAHVAEVSPNSDRWLHEIKYDGYRLLCQVRDSKVTCWTRRRQDWTHRFPTVVQAIEKLGPTQAYFDGEVVALLPNGVSSFPLLQTAFKEGRAGVLVYFVFDLLFWEGEDLREWPLENRKQKLLEVIPPSQGKGVLQFAEHFVGDGPEFFRQCCRFGLEGIISKLADRPYRSGRSYDWLKSKCVQIDQFVIGGFTEATGTRLGFRALLLGHFDPQGDFVYVGKVGTGFSESQLVELHRDLAGREVTQSPFANLTDRQADRGTHWVKPELVAQVQFSNWTKDGLLWHPSFQGIREDQAAAEIIRMAFVPAQEQHPEPVKETRGKAPGKTKAGSTVLTDGPMAKRQELPASDSVPQAIRAFVPDRYAAGPASSETLATFRLTNPQRVLHAAQGVTKLELATFYFEISNWILPHLLGRPLTLFRSPHGDETAAFYQRHAAPGLPDAIHQIALEGHGDKDFLMIADVVGLLSLVQIGVAEIHPWGAKADNVAKPDRLIFDLDPAPEVSWAAIVHASLLIRDQLAELGLSAFVKTTGGKGLHIVCPLQRRQTWEQLHQFARGFAGSLQQQFPDRFTISSSKSSRSHRIYIDFRRNTAAATAVAPYSTRARPGAPVSVPIEWEELSEITGSAFYRMGNLRDRLRLIGRDPWHGFWELKQSLTAKMLSAVQI